MDKYGNKLNHLECGDILFPPKIFLNIGTTSCQSIISVHDDMNEAIQKPENVPCPPGQNLSPDQTISGIIP